MLLTLSITHFLKQTTQQLCAGRSDKIAEHEPARRSRGDVTGIQDKNARISLLQNASKKLIRANPCFIQLPML
ncbi:MAG TPA: hypothetical protein VL485_32815, partial [Ktedonobacteraceae bacterium]|nr:hypothetical protein [Ktedonobacteraceae bacterium]